MGQQQIASSAPSARKQQHRNCASQLGLQAAILSSIPLFKFAAKSIASLTWAVSIKLGPLRVIQRELGRAAAVISPCHGVVDVCCCRQSYGILTPFDAR